MDLASTSKLHTVGEGDGYKSSQTGKNPARYIPPARRASPDSSGDENVQAMLNPTSRTFQKANMETTKRTRRSTGTDSSSTRTSSPKRVASHTKDKDTGELVEVWQNRRKGGNRAPKIEPEGTKNWRQPSDTSKFQPDDKEVIITNSGSDIPLPPIGAEIHKTHSLSPRIHQMPLRRWPAYPSILLDSIDMHLNILLQCIFPGARETSVRSLSHEIHRVTETRSFTPEMLSSLPMVILPTYLPVSDFVNLLSSVLTFFNLRIQQLAYLLCAEKAAQSKPGRPDAAAKEMMYSLAIAQINWDCSKDLVPSQIWSGFPVYDENTPQVRALRETSLCRALEKVQKYIGDAVRKGGPFYDKDSRQLKKDFDGGLILATDLPLCFTCLAHRWYGPVQAIPDYLALLRMAGFNPGERCPIQLPNPMEPRSVYEMTRQYLSLKGKSVFTTAVNQPQLRGFTTGMVGPMEYPYSNYNFA